MHRDIEFKKIYERDMDLLIMEEFVSDCGFARLFMDKLGLPGGYSVCKAIHSMADADGESDITIVLQYPTQKIALMIEDKIDAPTMPEQSERYYKRGNKGKEQGEFDCFYVILAAPSDYHEEHSTDKNAAYEHRICYEEMLDYFKKQGDARAQFKAAMIECALREKKAGYQVQEVPAVTQFWMKLRKYCKKHYPQLDMAGEDAPKGASACWPEFRTTLGNVKVIYKSQKGYVDLEFPKYGDKCAELLSIVGGKMTQSMCIRKTGKSASIRMEDDAWILDFNREFEECEAVVEKVLQAVSTLCEFASAFNYFDIY